MSSKPVAPERYIIRQVSSLDELREAFAVIGAQFSPPIPPEDKRLDDLVRRYPQDRSLMLLVQREGRIIGGALGFGSTLRILGPEPSARGKGLGRRLLQTFEVAAMRLGMRTLNLGADEAKGFYLRLGYHGKSSLHKELPAPSRVQDVRLKRLERLIGNLEVGQTVTTDAMGQVPSLFRSEGISASPAQASAPEDSVERCIG
ncbi:MAG: GNAT family N-acetyltransferase [Chloroflexi bacterium]|nr:GNAT family N-acetyltransferase [Chloroflexota bacterium]